MKQLTYAALAVFAVLMLADPALAQTTAAPAKYTGIGAGIGMGLAIVGAGIGIGLVGFAALSGIARQPEQAGTLRGTMSLLAALVEGAALIAVVFCLVLALIAS
jgi:F-type H+-transporting ATPase subunit c